MSGRSDYADETTVEGARKDLIDESYEYHHAVSTLAAELRQATNLTDPADAKRDVIDLYRDLIAVNATAAAYAYLLAAVLRIVEEKHGADEGLRLARLFDMVREAGSKVLEDANDDLDQRVSEFNAPAHLTTPGCHKCGLVFTFPHESLEHSQEPGTVYCRGCAGADAKNSQQRAKTMTDIDNGVPFEHEPGGEVSIISGRYVHQSGVIVEVDFADHPSLPYLIQVGGSDGPTVWLGADSIYPSLPLGPGYDMAVAK